MKYKRPWLPLIICIVIFAAACLLSSLFSHDDSEVWAHTEGGGQIVLSEIMSSNRTYPAPDGQYLDFIEVRNLSSGSVDISGYMIGDAADSVGYTFPDGSVLPGYGYAVCWCNKDSNSSDYADFGISRVGGESIYLYNAANVLVDRQEIPQMQANTSLVRQDEATWVVSSKATPGYENTDEGYAQWLKAMGGDDVQVTITEVVTDNSCISVGNIVMDYVELTNTGSKTADLTGAYLSNDPADPLKWQIPNLILKPGERTVLCCAGNGDGTLYAPFALSKSGCTVVLSGKLGNVLSQVTCPPLDTDIAWVLNADGTYAETGYATPGFENSDAGYQAWSDSVGASTLTVAISEIQSSNRSTILSANGKLCDWVELVNTGSSTINLSNAYLTDDPAERGKWKFPDISLGAGERIVIPCVSVGASSGEADFGLSKSGCTVALVGPQGNIITSVEVPRLENDQTWALQADGTYIATNLPSPGYENTDDGYLAFRKSQKVVGPLAISEVMSTNDQYFIQSDGRYYDWVELENISDHTINLADYYLSDDPDDLDALQLPQQKLEPGEQIIIICSANDQLIGNYVQAPFTLSSDECWLYVSKADGTLSDYMHIFDVPAQASIGRISGQSGVWYFEQPTPGNPNGTGVALVSQAPVIMTAEGIYHDVSKIKVEIQGNGQLHYTLDGSVPTEEDPVYKGPLTLNETTILRVISIEPDKFPSNATTACYIINENHTLPVVSLAISPEDMFSESGIYTCNTFDKELPCNLKMFDGSHIFSIDCGVELMGNPTNNAEKKSLKVNFRGRYGSDVLGYPIFGEEEPFVFDSLALSAGSDEGQTLFRDELFSQLCLDMSENTYARHYKFCVLYINGQYWGIYILKEDLGQMYYSQNAHASVDNVIEVREPAPFGSQIAVLADFCASHDLTVTENYDYVVSQLDIDSLIDWMILQGYSGNTGIGEDLRYYSSPETGNKFQLVLTDLDNGFYYRTGFSEVFATNLPWSYTDLTNALIANSDFRTRFLQKLQSATQSTLSNENVLALINSFEALLEPEIEREVQRWNRSKEVWIADVERLKTFITRHDHWALLEESLRTFVGLTEEEAARYFGT